MLNQVVINISSTGIYNLFNLRFIQTFDLIFPDVKRIMIEKKEEDLFEKIMKNKGQVNNMNDIFFINVKKSVF